MYARIVSHLPIINFFVSSTALGFQIKVLNPSYQKLSNDFSELKREITNKANNELCRCRKP